MFVPGSGMGSRNRPSLDGRILHGLVQLASPVRQEDAGEYAAVQCNWKVRAEADAQVKWRLHMKVNRRAILVH